MLYPQCAVFFFGFITGPGLNGNLVPKAGRKLFGWLSSHYGAGFFSIGSSAQRPSSEHVWAGEGGGPTGLSVTTPSAGETEAGKEGGQLLKGTFIFICERYSPHR